MIYLNFGAGNPADGWYNLDASPFFRIPRIIHKLLSYLKISARSDAFINSNYQYFTYHPGKRFPVNSSICSAIYSSCVLEHLPSSYIAPLLDEFFRILLPGGVVRIIVPDIEKDVRKACSTSDGWVNLNETLGIIPQSLQSNRIRSALEGWVGFPSIHKTFLLKKNLRSALNKHWNLKYSKGTYDSKIKNTILLKVESKKKYKSAIIVELIKKSI